MLEVRIDLRRDVDDLEAQAGELADRARVGGRLRVAGAVRHEDRGHVLGTERFAGQHRHQRGVDAPGEPHDDGVEANLVDLVADEPPEEPGDDAGVNRERVDAGCGRFRRR